MLKTVTINLHSVLSFEYLALKMTAPKSYSYLLSTQITPQISSDLTELLTLISSPNSTVLLLGDFNVHVDAESASANESKATLECFNIREHVDFLTHVHGHTLDLVCTSGLDDSVSGSLSGISDHYCIQICFSLPVILHRQDKIKIMDQNLKSIDLNTFSSALSASSLSSLLDSSLFPL